MSTHVDRVTAVVSQIASRPAGSRITVRKATPSHSIRDQAYKRGLHAIDVSALNHILEIDVERRHVRAEGQVTMGELAEATLAMGFVPAVVPEFRKFTVSGLINGEGIQSSSHRYGLFTHTLESVDVLTAAGEVITASRTANTDLFQVLPESLGTLGIVVSATFRLVPAKPFVRLTYRRFDALDEYLAAYTESLGVPNFHEGVIFGPRFHVLLTGEFVENPGGLPVFDVEREGGPYYFQHVRDLTATRRLSEEAMPTLAYLARPERGIWWMVECHVDFPLLTETSWGRKQVDRVVATAYGRAGLTPPDLTPEERDRCLINQDIGLRVERLGEGIRWVQQHLQVYPLWNCAMFLTDDLREPFPGSKHLVDLGIYGEPKVAHYRRVAAMRALQSMADAPSLWGISYLSWDEICAKRPGRYEHYERVRRQVGADAAFLHLRDKVVWIDPSTVSDLGRIPLWRLHRTYGARWYLNPVAYLVLGIGTLTNAAWRRPAGIGPLCARLRGSCPRR